MRFKIIISLHFLILTLLGFTSCTSYKQVPYLQGTDESQGIQGYPINYTSQAFRLCPGDVLAITVNAGREPSVAAAFNLPLQPSANAYSAGGGEVSQGVGRQSYQVNGRGAIDFPVLGEIPVSGKTREELEVYLKKELKTYIKDEPVVTVKMLNFKISVLGEVARPGEFTVNSDRINILEALSLSGDMTIYGKRDNVTIIREGKDGSLQKAVLDISSSDIIASPYFYLKQNDVVYVQPNRARAQSSDIGSQTGIWVSLGSMALTLASLIVVIAK